MFSAQFVSTVAAMFVAVIGFYVTTVVEELRSGEVIVYEAKRSPAFSSHGNQTIVFSLANVSRDKTVSDLKIGMRCKSGDISCFLDETYNEEYFAPIKGKIENVITDIQTTVFSVSLLPGARVALERQANSKNQSDLIVVYFPTSPANERQGQSLLQAIGLVAKPATPPDATPVLLKRHSVTALFVEHYFTVVAIAMLLSAVLLVSMLGYYIFKVVKQEPEGENEVQNLAVSLTYRRDQQSGQ